MVDNHGLSPSFRLQAFTHIIHNIRINIRYIHDQRFGIIIGTESGFFSGQPLMRAVSTDMHQCICVKAILQKKIISQILMRGRNQRIVI